MACGGAEPSSRHTKPTDSSSPTARRSCVPPLVHDGFAVRCEALRKRSCFVANSGRSGSLFARLFENSVDAPSFCPKRISRPCHPATRLGQRRRPGRWSRAWSCPAQAPAARCPSARPRLRFPPPPVSDPGRAPVAGTAARDRSRTALRRCALPMPSVSRRPCGAIHDGSVI